MGAIFVCLSVFTFHFVLGFFVTGGNHSYRGFWAEYAACRLFAALMLLAALHSWFSWPACFDSQSTAVQAVALAVAAAHALPALHFCARNALLCLRNVEYSEDELASLFVQWRGQEVLSQTLLDAQLAFVNAVQEQLHASHGPAGPASHRRPWLLLRQALILRRFRRAGAGDVPPPPARSLSGSSPRPRKPFVHAD